MVFVRRIRGDDDLKRFDKSWTFVIFAWVSQFCWCIDVLGANAHSHFLAYPPPVQGVLRIGRDLRQSENRSGNYSELSRT